MSWHFEPNRVPICPVKHIKQNGGFITDFFELLMDYQEVSPKNICQMEDDLIIYLQFRLLDYLFDKLFILISYSGLEIVILRLVERIVPNIVVSNSVPRIGYIFRRLLVSLVLGPIIHTPGNHVPANIPI